MIEINSTGLSDLADDLFLTKDDAAAAPSLPQEAHFITQDANVQTFIINPTGLSVGTYHLYVDSIDVINLNGYGASRVDFGQYTDFGQTEQTLTIYADEADKDAQTNALITLVVHGLGRELWEGDFNFTKFGPVLAAGTGDGAAAVTVTELNSIVTAAEQFWKGAITDSAQQTAVETFLNTLEFKITELDGAGLALLSDLTIAIDATAAENGWFIDSTLDPDSDTDSDFTVDGSSGSLVADSNSAAFEKYDLLTVVLHEMGHALGLAHSDLDGSLMDGSLASGTRAFISTADAAAVPADPQSGNATADLSDQQVILEGLDAFATWAEDLNVKLSEVFEGATLDLPFLDQTVNNVWEVTGGQIIAPIGTQIRNTILSVFENDDEVTSEDLLALAAISPGPSGRLTEFQSDLTLVTTGTDFELDLDILKDLGLDLTSFADLTQSEPLRLDGSISLQFGFGLEMDGSFFIEDPTLVATATLSHQEPLDVSLLVGPVGVGIVDGTIFLEVGVLIPTEGRYAVEDLSNLEFGSIQFDPQSSYEIDLPFELQGALAGLTEDVGRIHGSFNRDGNTALAVDKLSFAQFMTQVGETLNFDGPNFGALLDLSNVSLDQALEGIKETLISALDPDDPDDPNDSVGAVYRELPFINQSPVDLLGNGTVDVVEGIISGIEVVQANLTDINRFEIDLNQELNSILQLGLDLGGDGLDAAYNNLVALSRSLNAQSTDDDIAIALAEALPSTLLTDTILNRDVAAAHALLVTDLGLTVNSLSDPSDATIAISLATAAGSDYSNLLTDRATVQGASAPFTDDEEAAAARLGTLGLDENSTNEEIAIAVVGTQAVAGAIAGRGLLVVNSGIDPAAALTALTALGLDETSSDLQIIVALGDASRVNDFTERKLDRDVLAADAFLTDLGLTVVSQNSPSNEDIAIALAAGQQYDDLVADRDTVTNATDTLFLPAWIRLTDLGFDKTTTDQEIEDFYDTSDALAQATEARDILDEVNGPTTNDEKTIARVVLSRLGISDSATQGQIDAGLDRTAEIQQAKDDRDRILANENSEPAVVLAAETLAALGLNGESTDEAIAVAVAGIQPVNEAIAARDFVLNSGIVLSDATTRLGDLSLSLTSTDAEIAVALIDTQTFVDRKADRDLLIIYEANKSIDLEYTDSVLDLRFSMAKAVVGDYDLAFDLDDLPGLGALLSNEAFGIDLTSSGQVHVDADIDFDLNFTFDLSQIGSPQFIIYDDSQITFNKLEIDTLSPIDVTASFVVDGEPVLTLAIDDAMIDIDLTGTVSLVEDTEDHQYNISELTSLGFWNIDLLGTVNADLPMFFPTADTPFGGSDGDEDGDGIPDHVLHVDGVFRGDNDFDVNYAIPSFDLSAAFELFKLLNDPTTVINALDTMFVQIETTLSQRLASLNLPLIGDKLGPAADFVSDLRDDVVGVLTDPDSAFDPDTNPYLNGVGAALGPGILAGKTTVEILQEEIFKGIGFLLLTDPGDGTDPVPVISEAGHADLLARLNSSDASVREAAEAELVAESKKIQLVLGDDFIQLNVLFGDTFELLEIPLNFGLAVPGLGLEITSDTKIDIGFEYVFGLGFGFSVGDGIYVNTSGVNATGEELSLELTAVLKNATDETLPAELEAKLGFAMIELIDVLSTDPLDDGLESGFTGSFEIDLQDDGGDGRWSLIGEGVDIEARLSAVADVNLNGSLKLGSGAGFPSVTTVFHYEQIFAQATINSTSGFSADFGGAPRIMLENVSLDLGEFISEFITPILGQIKVITEPIEPIVNILTTPIPIISDFAPAPITLLDLAEAYGGDKFNRKYIDAVISVINVINSIPTDGDSIMIGFGDFVIMDGSPDNDLRQPDAALSDTDTTKNDQAYSNSGGVEGQLNNPTGKGSDGAPASKKSKGFLSKLGALEGLQIPLLSNPSSIFGLLAGKETDLFIYDMPPLVASFEYVQTFPIPVLPGLNVRLGGAATFTVDLGFGFDTSGFNQFLTSENPIDIFDGFFLTDLDLQGNERTEFSGLLEIFAGASLGVGGIVDAGVEGGLFAGIEFDLHDPNHDGKIRRRNS